MVGLAKLRQALLNKIANLFVKAIASSSFYSSSDGLQYASVDLLADEPKDEVSKLSDYGFYSKPLKGAQCFVVFPNGSRDEGFILKAFHQEYLPSPEIEKDGDIFLMHYKGHKIRITDEGIEVNTVDNKPINVTAKDVNIILEANGKFTVAENNFTVDK